MLRRRISVDVVGAESFDTGQDTKTAELGHFGWDVVVTDDWLSRLRWFQAGFCPVCLTSRSIVAECLTGQSACHLRHDLSKRSGQRMQKETNKTEAYSYINSLVVVVDAVIGSFTDP